MVSRISGFLGELKRRKVFHVAALYAVVGLGVVEGADIILPRLGLPDLAVNVVVGLVLLGFPIALVLAWAYEVRPEVKPGPEKAPVAETVTGDPGALRSIVVLPFENLSGDPEQEFFVAGMHDALITELAQISALRVISRTSAMAYKDRGVPVPEIARELNVDGVLEASVLRVGDRTRIQTQLIGAFPEEHHVWAQSYDREITDILALHSEVVKAVAEEVRIELTPWEAERLVRSRQVNTETYELYLKGMFHLYQYTPEGIENGLRYLNEAVARDPDEPLGHAGLGLAWAFIGHLPTAPADALPKAREAALKALELDDSMAEAHAALAEVFIYHDWDVESAGRSFRRALELNPNLAEIRGHYSYYLGLVEGWDGGYGELEQGRIQDPLNPIFPAWIAWRYCWGERWEEALVEAQRSLDLNPDFPIGLYAKGYALTGLGRFEEAIEAHKRVGAILPQFGWGLGCTYAAMGQEEEARGVAKELEDDLSTWNAWCIAEIHGWLGDQEGTIRWLEEALERRHAYIPWLNRVPVFDFVKDDPRFLDLVRRGNAPA